MALIPYDSRSMRPPLSWLQAELLRDVDICEWGLQQADHPRLVHDVVVDLRWMLARMHDMGDWNLLGRIALLMHRARCKCFQLCHALVHRCAVLVDACRSHYSVNSTLKHPAYDEMAFAVTACDDVLHFLVPSLKRYYVNDLRRCLVAFMADSESDTSDSATESAAKRLRSDDDTDDDSDGLPMVAEVPLSFHTAGVPHPDIHRQVHHNCESNLQ